MDVAFFDFENKNRTISNSNCTRFYQLVKEAEKRPELQKKLLSWPTQDKVATAFAGINDNGILSAEVSFAVSSWDNTVSIFVQMANFNIIMLTSKKHFSAKEILNRVETFIDTAERFTNVLGDILHKRLDHLYDICFDISNPMTIEADIDTREYRFLWTLNQTQMNTLYWTELNTAYVESLKNRNTDDVGRYIYHFQIFHTYVEASSIWPTAENHIDYGPVAGLVRGYNVQVQKADGELYWWSCEYIDGDPEGVFLDDFHYFLWSNSDCHSPTGRICFRGYGKTEYDPDERETFVKPISDNEVKKILGII